MFWKTTKNDISGNERIRPKRMLNAALAAVACGSLCLQPLPALASGPGGALGTHDDIRGMAYFRIPLGASADDPSQKPGFGFTVNRTLQFSDSLAHPEWSGAAATELSLDVFDLQFGLNGELNNFAIGGFNTLRAQNLLHAAEDSDPERRPIPTWVWYAIGAGIGFAIGYVAVGSLFKEDEPVWHCNQSGGCSRE